MTVVVNPDEAGSISILYSMYYNVNPAQNYTDIRRSPFVFYI